MSTQFASLQLADGDIFDPLRPRCQYNHNHVVRDLKALRKHELTCPDNPNRLSSSAESAASGHLASVATERHHDQRSLNGLRNNLSFSSVDSLHAEPDANIDVSDISSESEASHSDDESDECSSESDCDCESESDGFDSDEEDDHQDNEDHMDCYHEEQ